MMLFNNFLRKLEEVFKKPRSKAHEYVHNVNKFIENRGNKKFIKNDFKMKASRSMNVL